MRLVAVLCLALTLAAPLSAEEPGRLSVTGEGRVERVPDMATLSLGVTHEADSAVEAMAEVSDDMAAVLDRLRAAGLAERDLQTADLSVSPVWSGYDSGERRRITGFRASNMLTVRMRGLDALGKTLDAALGDGANDFQGLSFGLQEPGPAEDAARRAAVADAIRKAALYAEAAGLSLGPVVSISEGGAQMPPQFRMEAAKAASGGVPVAPGEISVSASVTMVFAIGG